MTASWSSSPGTSGLPTRPCLVPRARFLLPTRKERFIETERPQQSARKGGRDTQGEAIANVELDAKGQRLVSSITVEAVNELGISEGGEVVAVVKASDVMIAVEE